MEIVVEVCKHLLIRGLYVVELHLFIIFSVVLRLIIGIFNRTDHQLRNSSH